MLCCEVLVYFELWFLFISVGVCPRNVCLIYLSASPALGHAGQNPSTLYGIKHSSPFNFEKNISLCVCVCVCVQLLLVDMWMYRVMSRLMARNLAKTMSPDKHVS